MAARSFVPGVLVLLASLVPDPAGAQEIDLHWKLKEGQKLAETMEVKTVSRTSFGGQDVKASQSMVINSTRSVGKLAADGKAELIQTPERLRVQVSTPTGQGIDYDSQSGAELEGPAAGAMGPMLKALIGADLKFQMSPKGKVENVKLPEALLKAIQLPAGAPSGGGLFTEESLKQMCEAFPVLPEGPMEKGKRWTDHRKIAFPLGAMHSDNTYTYEGVEKKNGKDLHKISIKTSVSLEKDPAQSVEIKLKPNESVGVLYFDNEAGRFVELIQTQKLEMQIVGVGAPGVDTSSESTSTWRLEEPADPKKAEK